MVVRRDDQRRVPVPFVGVLISTWLRGDRKPLAGDAVKPRQAAVLILRINNIGVGRIELRLVAITELGDPPVSIADAVGVGVAGRSAQREIILGAATHIVERIIVVGCDPVKLRCRQVPHMPPGITPVPALVNTAIATDEQMFCVARINPQSVVVHVAILK